MAPGIQSHFSQEEGWRRRGEKRTRGEGEMGGGFESAVEEEKRKSQTVLR